MNNKIENTELIEPWYKQFWPWFIMALPASAVVAGIITVFIAFDNADSLVVDDYYKAGLAVNDQIQLQKNAMNYGYAAKLRRLADNRLFLKFDNAAPEAQELELQWVHPVDAKKDFSIVMNRQNDGSFHNKSANDISGRWYLRMSHNDDWLLKSEISSTMDVAHLTPSLN